MFIVNAFEDNPTLFVIVSIILLFISYKLVKTFYFSWIKETTGYNPFHFINIILLILTVILPFMNMIRDREEAPTTKDLILLLIPITLILIHNFIKIKNPIHSILVTLLLVVIGIPAIFGTVISFVVSGWAGGSTGTVSSGNSGTVSNSNQYINGTSQSWSGHENDNQRANELGFQNVQEAIDNGYSYDGRIQ